MRHPDSFGIRDFEVPSSGDLLELRQAVAPSITPAVRVSRSPPRQPSAAMMDLDPARGVDAAEPVGHCRPTRRAGDLQDPYNHVVARPPAPRGGRRLAVRRPAGSSRTGPGAWPPGAAARVIELKYLITVYPAREESGRWRAVWYENGERQQCEAGTEEKLAAKLEKAWRQRGCPRWAG
jgi:hypothetical protein